jgi:hypothetical protein
MSETNLSSTFISFSIEWIFSTICFTAIDRIVTAEVWSVIVISFLDQNWCSNGKGFSWKTSKIEALICFKSNSLIKSCPTRSEPPDKLIKKEPWFSF